MGNLMRGAGLALLLVASAGCDDAQAPRPTREIRVRVTLRDSGGQPVERGEVGWVIWFPPANDSLPGPPVGSVQWTDSAGQVVVFTDQFAPEEADSLELFFSGPGCGSPSRRQLFTDVAALGDTGITLVVDSLLPAARLQSGSLCAAGREGPSPWSSLEDFFTLALRVDVISGPVFQGRWAAGFTSSRGGYNGDFVGAVTGGAVTLTLTNEAQPSHCSSFQLQGFLRTDGSWEGLVPVEAVNGCFVFQRPVDFVISDYYGTIP